MKNNKLIILIAPPCSGKSTFIRNDEYKNYTIISTDNIITNMYPELTYNEAFKKSDYKEVRRIMRSELLAAISKKTDIIVDRTNMNVKTRKEFINSVDESYEKIAIVLPWDKKTFLERNEIRNSNEGKHISLDVWENFCNIYQKPTFEEGFDKIIIL